MFRPRLHGQLWPAVVLIFLARLCSCLRDDDTSAYLAAELPPQESWESSLQPTSLRTDFEFSSDLSEEGLEDWLPQSKRSAQELLSGFALVEESGTTPPDLPPPPEPTEAPPTAKGSKITEEEHATAAAHPVVGLPASDAEEHKRPQHEAPLKAPPPATEPLAIHDSPSAQPKADVAGDAGHSEKEPKSLPDASTAAEGSSSSSPAQELPAAEEEAATATAAADESHVDCEALLRTGNWSRLLAEAERGYTAEEQTAVFAKLGLGEAGATCQEEPKAIFILGPPSVGKGTVAHDFEAQFGFGVLPTGRYDAVLLDPHLLLHGHTGYQALNFEIRKHGCMYKPSSAVKHNLIKLETQLKGAATNLTCRRNVLFPLICSRYHACIQNIELLKQKGYVVSVVSVYSKEEVVLHRALERANRTGEPYNHSVFVPSISAFVPVMRVANGACWLVDTRGSAPKLSMNFSCPDQAPLAETGNEESLDPNLVKLAEEVAAGSGVWPVRFQQVDYGKVPSHYPGRTTSVGGESPAGETAVRPLQAEETSPSSSHKSLKARKVRGAWSQRSTRAKASKPSEAPSKPPISTTSSTTSGSERCKFQGMFLFTVIVLAIYTH